MRKIALLGSTGSIGSSTLRIAEHLPEELKIVALGAHSNIERLSEQIPLFQPEVVAVYDQEKARELQKRFPNTEILAGKEGMAALATHPSVDYVVMAIVGMAALDPTIQAIRAGKTIGLASKEVLVSAGEYIMSLVNQTGATLLPMDSEHSALFQCLEGKEPDEIRRLVITASGGPFLNHTFEQMERITLEEALVHPNWKMGPKITVDSSTLVNKGLEVIEARWLFQIPPEKIEVVVHPQSIVHGIVEWCDGSMIAQINEPDMIYPIQYALTYPLRKKGIFPPYDFVKNSRLDFYSPDFKKFPALRLALDTLKEGKSAPCYFNAANEALVSRFLKRELSWREIQISLEKLLERHQVIETNSLEAILNVDQQARVEALLV